MKNQTVYSLNQKALEATRYEERFYTTIYNFFSSHELQKPTETLHFVLEDFVLLSEDYIKEYLMDSVYETNRIIEFISNIYYEFKDYASGRSDEDILPKSLTNIYLMTDDFYNIGKLSQPVGTLHDVIAQWLYLQTEGLDQSRIAHLKEFNRVAQFLINLKEAHDLLSSSYEYFFSPKPKECLYTTKEKEDQEEERQALYELWDEAEEEAVCHTDTRTDRMFNVMHKMNDCKTVFLQLQGILSVEQNEADRAYFVDMYEWISNKILAMRDDLQGIFDLERSLQF